MTRTLTLVGYALVVVAGALVELAARRRGGATFGDALAAALRPRPVRLLLLAGWLWFGWHVFVRVDWR
ncbi:MAG: hypothetical protein JXA83_04235 [Acidimicrobiales bacterium]|nr:hypothetical protein [Acidimicrobiales bacterium]